MSNQPPKPQKQAPNQAPNQDRKPKPFDPTLNPNAWRNPNQTYLNQPIEPPQIVQIKQPAKPWYQSKTLWFNAAVATLGAATSATPYLQPFVTPEKFGMVTAGLALGNAVLRFMTHKPIKGGVGSE